MSKRVETENKPNHAPDCIFVEAQKLVEQEDGQT